VCVCLCMYVCVCVFPHGKAIPSSCVLKCIYWLRMKTPTSPFM